MTGLATGPHLHYDYLTNGVHRNPQTVQLPGAEPLRAQDLQRFRELAEPLLSSLSPPQQPAAVAAVTPAIGAAPAGATPTGTAPAASAATGSGNASSNAAPAIASKASVN